MEQQQRERSLGELFGDLSRDLGNLVRKEVELARTELTYKATETGKDLGFLAVGGLVAFGAFLTLCATLIILLSEVAGLPWWLSALIVTLILAAVGFFLVQKALNALKNRSLVPEETVETIKEDVEWAKDQAS